MNEFCHDYLKPKHGEKAKSCYMDTESFIVFRTHLLRHCKIFQEARFRTSNYGLDRPLPKRKKQKELN